MISTRDGSCQIYISNSDRFSIIIKCIQFHFGGIMFRHPTRFYGNSISGIVYWKILISQWDLIVVTFFFKDSAHLETKITQIQRSKVALFSMTSKLQRQIRETFAKWHFFAYHQQNLWTIINWIITNYHIESRAIDLPLQLFSLDFHVTAAVFNEAKLKIKEPIFI